MRSPGDCATLKKPSSDCRIRGGLGTECRFMDMFLIKILAAFLALSQVTTRPDAIATRFDPVSDTAAVTRIMRDGCAQMRKALHGLKSDDLIVVYRQLCKNEDVKDSPIDIGAVIRFYDEAMEDLPDA